MEINSNELIIHSDGGARGNPGPAAAAFVAEDLSGEIFSSGKYLGQTTNNVAEYSGVIIALQWLKGEQVKYPQADVKFFLDSELVVNQLNGIFKIKDQKLRELILQVRSLETEIKKNIYYKAVPREKNFRADFLVNQTLDQQTS